MLQYRLNVIPGTTFIMGSSKALILARKMKKCLPIAMAHTKTIFNLSPSLNVFF